MPADKNKKPLNRRSGSLVQPRLFIGAITGLVLIALILSGKNQVLRFFGSRHSQFQVDSGTAAGRYIPLSLEYSITDNETSAVRQGRYNDICQTGDIIKLNVTPGMPCRLMIFCIDSMRIPIPVFPSYALEPRQVEAGTLTVPSLELNDVTGQEFYYAVASVNDFSFRDIASPLDTTLALLETGNGGDLAKGPSTQIGTLRLPKKFTSDFIYFRHIGRQKNIPADSTPSR